MIITERKPLAEITSLINDNENILLLGCAGCTAICQAGGEKEVSILASALRLKEQRPLAIEEVTVQRQCEYEFIDPLKEKVEKCDVIVSMACGIGVQALAQRFSKLVVPAVNTKFLGMPEKQGLWLEKCLACGNCVLGVTGGICPIARCSKNLLNGPCGGSQKGKCEVNPKNIDCAWQLIYDRLQTLGQLDLMEKCNPPKDWRTSRDGGPRRIIRQDLISE